MASKQSKPPSVPPKGPYYVFSTLPAAQSAKSAVDGALGYPKAGVFATGGIQPATPFVTQTYANVLVHPAGNQWAYPSDANIDAAVVGLVGLPGKGALAADWAGATVAVVAGGGAQVAMAPQRLSTGARVAMGIAAAAGVGAAAYAALHAFFT